MGRRSIRRGLVLLLLLVTPAWAGMPEVIDGDTLRGKEGEKLRIAGIDAPEMDQVCIKNNEPYHCGVEAKKTMVWILSQANRLECNHHPNRRDKYGRTLATCGVFVDGFSEQKDIAWVMVRLGWAVAYRKYSTYYVEAEDLAREDGVGMWAGEFDMPWDWRAAR